MRLRFAPVAALSLLAAAVSASANEAPVLGPDSHQPIPRFVSLRTEGANGRHGPSLEHKVDWIYERAGLPLEVTAESGPWRRVRDPDGAQVWIHARNLDDRQMVYIRAADDVALRGAPRPQARIEAWLAKGVVGAVTGCDGDWRRVAIAGRVGWVEAQSVWGADACKFN